MWCGIMFNSGDVVLAKIQFIDTFEVKTRPVVILFEEFDNVVVAGITSNVNMKGIEITKKDGMIKDSVIKMNYIFTISKNMISKKLLHLPQKKKQMIYKEFMDRLSALR